MAEPTSQKRTDDLNRVSPLLGVSSAQKAVDGLAKNIWKINDGLTKASIALARMEKSGSYGFGSSATQSGGKPNGGGARIGKAYEDVLIGGGGGNGGNATGQQTGGKPNGGSRTMAVAGMFAAAGQANMSTFVATNTTAQMMARTSTMPWRDVRSSIMRNNVTATDSLDAMQAGSTIGGMGYAAGSKSFNAAMGYNKTFGYIDPTLSASQVANAQAQMTSGWTSNFMASRGISVIGQNGKRMTPREMTDSVMRRTGLDPNRRWTKAESARFSSSTGVGGVAIEGMLRQGVIDQDTAAVMRSEMNARTTASANGFSYDEYKRAADKGDTNALKRMGVTSTDANALKNLDAKRRNVEDNLAGGFSSGLTDATAALGRFIDMLDSATNGPLGNALGYGQGFMGAATSGAGGAAAMMLGSKAVGAAGKALLKRGGVRAATQAATRAVPALGEAAGGGGAAAALAPFAFAGATAGALTYFGFQYDQSHKDEGWGKQGGIKADLRPGGGSVVVGDGKGGHTMNIADMRKVANSLTPEQAAIATGQGGSTTPSQTDKTGKSGARTISLLMPMKGRITGKFGPRKAPKAGASTNHKGIDIGAPSGTPVVAANSGTVSLVSFQSARGNYVIIDHGNGLSTLYQHLSASRVRQGQSVSRGQTVGSCGTTGVSTGPHLHFEVHRNGTPVDPMPYLSGGGMLGTGNSDPMAASKDDAGATARAAGPAAAAAASGPTGTSEAALVEAALGSYAGGSSTGGQSTGSADRASGSNAASANAKSGAMPKGSLASWIKSALGILKMDYGQWGDEVNTIIKHESGGNPRAVNNWDSNAKKGTPSKGLMQTIQPTFDAHKLPGHNDIFNPVDNIIAGVRYAVSRYGSLDNVPGIKSMNNGGKYKGYAVGSTNIDVDQIAKVHKGEMVLDADSAEKFRQVLSGNNSTKGMLGGGGRKVDITFAPNSIVLHASGPMNDSQATDFARKIVTMVGNESELLTIAEG